MSDTRITHSTHGHGVVRHRVVPSAVTFLVAAAGIYLTAYLAIGIIQHIVMPILAVGVAGWLAVQVYRHTGDDADTSGQTPPTTR